MAGEVDKVGRVIKEEVLTSKPVAILATALAVILFVFWLPYFLIKRRTIK